MKALKDLLIPKISYAIESCLVLNVQQGQLWHEGDLFRNPNYAMIEHLQNNARNNKIILVSHRKSSEVGEIKKFVDIHKLNIDRVICSGNRPIGILLEKAGVYKHYTNESKKWDDPNNVYTGLWVKYSHPSGI